MSGGVDSSVAALLSSREEFDTIGVTLRFLSCGNNELAGSCCGVDGEESARAVAEKIGIPHYVIDCSQEFRKMVLEYAWNEYHRGRTPNPCISCNSKIKFGFLLDYAGKLGATGIVTGHYARMSHAAESGKRILVKGMDRSKDQSYFLFSLSAAQLDSAIFPLGGLTKRDVRGLAREANLPCAARPGSQDACISSDGESFPESLRKMFKAKAEPGHIVDESHGMIGRHSGIHRFTVGQRRGLGISLGRRAYVLSLDPEKKEIKVGTETELLMSRILMTTGVKWSPGFERFESGKAQVKIRYNHLPANASVHRTGQETAAVYFENPQKAITAGQAAVFYQGDMVVGGGWIDSNKAARLE